ncbi:MAG: DUF421 domain-containing protein [Clostridia bacterium]|nr:DUF421 domain-containing protein [Clostridia bacterium]
MISIFIRTIIIYVILNIMLKIMGKRQIGELEVNELVSTLLISEIGALPISDTDIPLLPSLFPILFIASTEVIISVIKNKSALIKKAVEGEPAYIIYKGRLRQKVLAENRISINEILTEMRTQGIADLEDVRYALLEQNGKVSFLKQSDSPNISKTLVVDTKLDRENIREAGLTEIWVIGEVKKRGLTLDDVFLMTVNEDGKIKLIKKEK